MSRKVAVVAIHGVANQKPYATARDIARLLANANPGTFDAFHETRIRMPLQPAMEPGKPPRRSMVRILFDAEERPFFMRPKGMASVETPVDPAQAFMRDQLQWYESDPAVSTYDTIRLETMTLDGNTAVDVYEAYWADLSKLGSGIAVFFGELYQLLLHLPSLGRIAVDTGSMMHRTAMWTAYASIQRWTVRMLTIPIVVLNLVLLSALLPVLSVSLLQTTIAPRALVGAPAALVAIIIAGYVLFARKAPPLVLWLIAVPAIVLLCVFGVRQLSGKPLVEAVASTAWCVGAAAILAIVVIYNRRRPGALGPAIIALAIAFAALLWRMPKESVAEASLHSCEVVLLLLDVAWVIHVPLLVIALAVGVVTALIARERQGWRTVWTAAFSLSFATALFATLTLAAWMTLMNALTKLLPAQSVRAFSPVGDDTDPIRIISITAHNLWLAWRIGSWDALEVPLAYWVHKAIVLSGSRLFVITTIALAIFALMAMWSIAPSVVAEMRPPRRDGDPARIAAMGIWLSRGLNLIPFVALTFPALFVLGFTQAVIGFDVRWTEPFLASAAAGLAFMIASRFWLPGASGALDVMLDVDSHLRQSPRKRTVRAQIAERYASLLRFVNSRAYDRVVIIAHSQGSVITADLLRFLSLQKDPIIDALHDRLTLFTMGNPLLQLYARTFPYLYRWVLPDGPAIGEVSASAWVNAYRSGDYVGRWIWTDGKFAKAQWSCDEAEDQDRTQVCIGEGAHTHYWDYTGSKIGRELAHLLIG